jgi:hypothetical protein
VTLREDFLAAIEREIADGQRRLGDAREHLDEAAPRRVQALTAIADVTLESLIAERDRLRAGAPFDEDAARRFLDSQNP